MTEKVGVTIQIHPNDYRVMTKRAEAAGIPLHRLIEASIAGSCRPTAADVLKDRVAAIKRLHARGLNDRQIADELDIPQATVYHHRHVSLHLPKNDPRGGKNRYTKEKAA
jgi:DNA-binding NarL/FixJ family response regulator